MCTGRVDLSFPLRAFLEGADGVFVGGCWPGECHYLTEGNYDALGNMRLLKKLLQRVGVDPRRLRLEWLASSEGVRFAESMDDFVKELGALGPLGAGPGSGATSPREGLESLQRMVPQLKILVRERLQVRVKSEDAYEKLYADPKVDGWIDALMGDPASTSDDLPGYWIDPEKCVGCLLCHKKCPVHAIEGSSKTVHVIDAERCTHCGTCFYACPPRISAVRRVVGARGQRQPSGEGSPATLQAPFAGPEGKSS